EPRVEILPVVVLGSVVYVEDQGISFRRVEVHWRIEPRLDLVAARVGCHDLLGNAELASRQPIVVQVAEANEPGPVEGARVQLRGVSRIGQREEEPPGNRREANEAEDELACQYLMDGAAGAGERGEVVRTAALEGRVDRAIVGRPLWRSPRPRVAVPAVPRDPRAQAHPEV